MRKKLFTLLLAVAASVGTMFAWDYERVQIGDLYYNLDATNQTAEAAGNRSASGEIIIPASVTYNEITYSVTSIGGYAFAECTGLTSVTIPNSVTSIGNSAFKYCSSLISIEIPNSVTSIGDWAFRECTSLISATIPNSVTSIGDSAFEDCNSLTSIEIPNSVTSIGDYAFSRCSGLTSVTIPNSVTSIGDYAFAYCSGLTSVTIPNSVTSIGNSAFQSCSKLPVTENIRYADTYLVEAIDKTLSQYTIKEGTKWIGSGAFYKCENITSIAIPNSVIDIGWMSFFMCENLWSVTIPNSVIRIEGYAFKNCNNLTYIYIQAIVPPVLSGSAFSMINDNAIFYIPFGSTNAYISSPNWKNMNLKSPNIQYSTNTLSTSASIMFDVERTEILSCGIEGGEQQPGNVLEYIGLEPNSEYADIPIVLTANTGETETVNVSFSTPALELTTKPSKPVSSTTAILLAETNMSDAEVSCGFEYKRNDAPADMDGTKVFCPVASGQMAGRLKGLKDDVYYKYRAFYQSAAGNMYYGDWQYIFTGDVAVEFDPILYTYEATIVRENEATISGYALAGSEDFTEQGFEYWAESRANSGANAPRRMAAAIGEHKFAQASGIKMTVTLTDLDEGTVYKYRAYGKAGEQYFYGTEQTFTTNGTYTPLTYMITFVNWDGTELQASPVEENMLPVYTGHTPVRPEDAGYTYTFDGWTPAIVIATADATYTATYTETPKGQGIDGVQSNHVQCTKVIHNGQILILRGDKTYTLQGQEIK